jgi:chromosome segregation ATPase
MAPSKRKSVVPATAPCKKAKVDEWADVSKELMKAELPAGVYDMLEAILPLTLGEFADHRHKYQEQVVQALDTMMKDFEDRRSKDVMDLQANLEEANRKKPESEESRDEALRRRDEKAAEVREKKDALAAAALAFRAARAETTKAAEAKRTDEVDFNEAMKKKAEFSSMMEDLAFLRDAPVDDRQTTDKRSSLIASMRRCNFEEAMMVVLPAVFAKPPSSRGEFDDIALEGLAASLQKRLSQQETVVAEGAPLQEERRAAIVAAEDALESAEVRQVEAAESYTAVDANLQACEDEATSSSKAVREACARIKKISSSLTTAEAELEIFRDGPLANFRRLQQRVSPPAVEEPATTTHEDAQEPGLESAPVVATDSSAKETAPTTPTAEVVDDTAA